MWVWTDNDKDRERDFVNVGQATRLRIMSAGEYADATNTSAPLLLGGETLFFVSLGPERADLRLLATIPGGDHQAKQVEAIQGEVQRLLAREAAVLDIRLLLSADYGASRQMKVY